MLQIIITSLATLAFIGLMLLLTREDAQRCMWCGSLYRDDGDEPPADPINIGHGICPRCAGERASEERQISGARVR